MIPPIPNLEFWLSLAVQVSFYLLVALTLNLQYGYTGIPNFGIVLAVGGGGLAAAVVDRLLPQWLLGIPGDPISQNAKIVAQINVHLQHDPWFALVLFVITIAVAVGVGALSGVAASLPAVRLSGDYLAIMLFVLGYVTEIIGLNDYFIVNGSQGVILPDPFIGFGVNRFWLVTILTIASCVVFMAYLRRLIRSPLARSLRAIRDNETTAKMVGRDVVSYRLKVMAVGAAVGGLAGGLYSFYALGINGSTFTRTDWSYNAWLIMIFGGMGNNLGAFLGALVFISARQFVVFYEPLVASDLPFNVVYLEYLVIGLVLVAVMIYRPKGILPEKSGITVRRKNVVKQEDSSSAHVEEPAKT